MARRTTPETERFELRVPSEQLARWQELADVEGLPLSAVVKRAMGQALKSAERRGILAPEKKIKKAPPGA